MTGDKQYHHIIPMVLICHLWILKHVSHNVISRVVPLRLEHLCKPFHEVIHSLQHRFPREHFLHPRHDEVKRVRNSAHDTVIFYDDMGIFVQGIEIVSEDCTPNSVQSKPLREITKAYCSIWIIAYNTEETLGEMDKCIHGNTEVEPVSDDCTVFTPDLAISHEDVGDAYETPEQKSVGREFFGVFVDLHRHLLSKLD